MTQFLLERVSKSVNCLTLVAFFIVLVCMPENGLALQGKSKKKSKSTSSGKNHSLPKKKIGVGFPSPYSYSKPAHSNSKFTNRSHTHPSSQGFRSDHTTYSSPSHAGHNHSNYNRSRGGSYLSISPYGLNFSYGNRGGVSTYYRPTNTYRNNLGISGYSTDYGPTYGSGYNNFGSYYGADYLRSGVPVPIQPQTIVNGEIANRTITNDVLTNGSIANEFYPQIPTSATGRSIQRRAEMAFKNGDYRSAESLASQAIVIERDNGRLMLFASQTSFANGNFSQAVTYLKKATETLPSEQWNSVVKNYKEFYGRNDYVTQTNRLTQHLASRPTDADAYALRGYHYGSLGYVEAATIDFQRALAVNPNHELATRLQPVLGSGFPPASQEIEAPVPTEVFSPSTTTGANDRMIYLIPQATNQIEPIPAQQNGTPVMSTPQVETVQPVTETGSSILLKGPGK